MTHNPMPPADPARFTPPVSSPPVTAPRKSAFDQMFEAEMQRASEAFPETSIHIKSQAGGSVCIGVMDSIANSRRAR